MAEQTAAEKAALALTDEALTLAVCAVEGIKVEE